MIILPVAMSGQFDYSVTPNVYVNASIIQRIYFSKYEIQRPNQVAVTPRYEKRNWEVAMPYSLYNYKYSRIGLAGRYKWIVLGTDKLGAFLGTNDLTGFDFYFGFKFSPGGGSSSGSGVCPAY